MSDISSWTQLSGEETALEALAAQGLEHDRLEKLYKFCQALKTYNEHTNLVANSDLSVVLKDHIFDSLRLLPHIRTLLEKEKNKSLADIGSGAGFPGLVLAIAEPTLKVTLIESIGKKSRFLESVVAELELQNQVSVVCDRAEIIGHDKRYREKFALATARAVGALPMVAEICLPLLKVNGHLLAQRSKRQALEEETLIDAYASRMGGTPSETVHFEVDILGREMSLITIRKTKNSPGRFPRNAAMMKRDLGQ